MLGIGACKPLTAVQLRPYGATMTGARFLACVALCAVAGCGGGVESAAHPGRAFALPDNGWQPGDAALLGLVQGRFHAQMTARGPCAIIGKPAAPVSYRWPTGYRVRFHPTQLIDPHGNVVAAEGDEVRSAGGLTGVVAGSTRRHTRPVVATWCGKPGDNVFDIQGDVTVPGS